MIAKQLCNCGCRHFQDGGGVYIHSGQVDFVTCVISGNAADYVSYRGPIFPWTP